MRDKSKKRYTMFGLLLICFMLIPGIGVSLFKEPSDDKSQENVETTEQEVFVSTEMDTPKEELEESGRVETEPEKAEETTVTDETAVTVPEIKTENQVEENTQELQPEPEKTTEQKPEGAPSEEETPVTEQTAVQEPVQETQTAPAHGQTSGNMIYIHGFGWIENHGGGGEGIYAADMYENGNKVGSMD